MEDHHPILPTSEGERIANQAEQSQRLADTIPGKCTECHQLPAIGAKFVSQQLKVRAVDCYQVPERDSSVREFTKFQHSPHLTLPALADCRYCHQEKSAQPLVSPSLARPLC